MTQNCVIQTPTPNVQTSLNFYSKLGFKTLSNEPTIVSDGQAFVEINPDRYARAGVKLFHPDWSGIIKSLESETKIVQNNGDFFLVDPSGVWIYLIAGGSPLSYEKEPCFSVLGNFAGISLESADLARSVRIWSLLGFKTTSGSPDSGWVSMLNYDLAVSIMKPLSCPHLFFNPSLTYFNGKENNPKIIQKVKDLEIPIAEEITHFNAEGIVDNIIIRDPGGYGFFIFND